MIFKILTIFFFFSFKEIVSTTNAIQVSTSQPTTGQSSIQTTNQQASTTSNQASTASVQATTQQPILTNSIVSTAMGTTSVITESGNDQGAPIEENSSSKGSSSIGIVIGVVVGMILCVILLGFIVLFLFLRKKNAQPKTTKPRQEPKPSKKEDQPVLVPLASLSSSPSRKSYRSPSVGDLSEPNPLLPVNEAEILRSVPVNSLKSFISTKLLQPVNQSDPSLTRFAMDYFVLFFKQKYLCFRST